MLDESYLLEFVTILYVLGSQEQMEYDILEKTFDY